MKILSMTATFGKLNHETLTLEPGLNIIDRPNEWGKSTWCAFLIAMLYGIDTSERDTFKNGVATKLAVKNRFAPWSGAPMSGRMDILWNGKKITIERKNTSRAPFAAFRAYETDTGLDVDELTAENCGQTLLGVERGVYTRSGFLKLTDLPVEQDEALRRRLNDLVTTGDESGTADALAQTLKTLKNHCRSNSKNGLLPQTEVKRDALLRKLSEIDSLQEQSRQILARQQVLSEERKDLENHRQALLYAANATYNEKMAAAKVARDGAEAALLSAEAAAKDLPAPEALEGAMEQASRLQEARDELHTQAQLLPPPPNPPETAGPFRGRDPRQVTEEARKDTEALLQLEKNQKKPGLLIGAIVLFVAAAVCAILGKLATLIACGVLLLAGGLLLILLASAKQKLRQQADKLHLKYHPLDPADWCREAERFEASQRAYAAQLAQREAELKALNARMEENRIAIETLTGGRSLSQFRQDCDRAMEQHEAVEDARIRLHQARQLLEALTASHKEVAPPKYADKLTLTEQQTHQALAQNEAEHQHLLRLFGNCQGQMESLGDAAALGQQLQKVEADIARLQETYQALEIAQDALKEATEALQRRFAPRISQRATELLRRLTGGRYDRLNLDSNFTVNTAAEDETAMQNTLWRSDGTVDQLYLALRLAVAEELTADAPLVLDDALVRFDDTRLAAALEILKEEATTKQILLFTCQSRESALLN